MRKTLFVLVGALSLLSSCGGKAPSAKTNSRKTTYIDYPTIVDGSLSLTLDMMSDNQTAASLHSFTLSVVSSELKPVTFTVSSPKIIRESNGAEYTAHLQAVSPELTLECDVPGALFYFATLPTNASEDHYYFSFQGNKTTYRFYLYEMPDHLREQRKVYYSVDGMQGTFFVPDGRFLSSYDWISRDYIYGCDKWYADSSFTEALPEDYIVRNDIVIYGKKQSILKYGLYPNGLEYKTTGYNFIPSTGEIVVPKFFEEKAVFAISSGTFGDQATGLKTLYIPKLSSVSFINNFHNCKDLETIYFEGTRDDWEKVTDTSMLSLPEKTRVIFGVYK